MCGIFGVIRKNHTVSNRQISGLVRQLFLRSESRGKDASGVAVLEGNVAHVLKRRVRGKKLIQLAEYQRLFNEHPRYTAVLGHCRMETNGSSRLHENNQPVCKHNMLCLHNGIVSNQDYIRRTCAALQLDYGVDTEIFLELIRLERQSGVALGKALHKALAETDGAYSLALVDPASALIILTTNNGSLYLWEPDNLGLLVFASEFRILARALMASSFGSKEIISGISQAAPRAMIERRLLFSNPESVNEEVRPAETEPAVIDYGPVVEVPAPACSKTSLSEKLCLDGDYLRASVMAGKLQRCSRCILPETFPNIRYDDNGVCNYCRAYRAMCPKGVDNLREEIRRLAGEGGVSCIVPLSGGRDSCYGLHYLKKELGLLPVAFTYDWGMVTDLARRNISRMCGALGVEHILVAADIGKKRDNIRKNVIAWFNAPSLGTIPLLMAGDKAFFYHAAKLKKDLKLRLLFFCMNPLERTDFKVGFAGVNETIDTVPKRRHFLLSWGSSVQLFAYYCREALRNPLLLNSSIMDSVAAFVAYYYTAHDYLMLYNYIPWDEDKVVSTLCDQYSWEREAGCGTTWRIGDGTSAFYNYIYFLMAGFTENDTLRSNQVREGQLTREDALRLAERDNAPRFSSIQWYCETIGLDWREVLARAGKLSGPLAQAVR